MWFCRFCGECPEDGGAFDPEALGAGAAGGPGASAGALRVFWGVRPLRRWAEPGVRAEGSERRPPRWGRHRAGSWQLHERGVRKLKIIHGRIPLVRAGFPLVHTGMGRLC